MKQFKDLKFKPHSIGNGVQARMDFPNGYGVSVVKFNGTYGYPDLWEVAIMYEGSLTYNTDITDDVLGHQTEEDVTEVMRKVQELKNEIMEEKKEINAMQKLMTLLNQSEELRKSTLDEFFNIRIAEFETSQIAQQIQIIELMLKIKGVEL